MDFSEAHNFNGQGAPAFSADGRFIACAVDARCVIRDAESLAIFQIFSCQGKIDRVQWSPGGKHLLCALHSRAIVQVWNIDDESWSCKIDQGPAGIAYAQWSSTGRKVLVTADFNLRLSLWDIKEQTCLHRAGPKFSDRAMAYSPNGMHLAVAERVNLKDYVTVYSEGEPESSAVRIRTNTRDLEDLAWSPDSAMIAVWDSPLAYRISVYQPDGRFIGTFEAYEGALGIRTVQWSPDSQLLAIGSYDQVVRVLSTLNWKPAAVLEHPEKVTGDTVVALEEVRDGPPPRNGVAAELLEDEEDEAGDDQENQEQPAVQRRYAVGEQPFTVANVKADVTKPDPAMGVAQLAFSPTGRFLASVNENQAEAVWIWDMQSLSLTACLAHERPVRRLAWEPLDDKLAICTASRRLHLWTPDGASCVHIPLKSMHTENLFWKPDGTAAIVTDRDRFCVGYVA